MKYPISIRFRRPATYFRFPTLEVPYRSFGPQDVFIATKVGPGIADIKKACQDSLSRLGMSYVDLYYIHSPFFELQNYKGTLDEAWKAMEGLVDAGLTKQIAVSNYRVQDLKQFVPSARIKVRLVATLAV